MKEGIYAIDDFDQHLKEVGDLNLTHTQTFLTRMGENTRCFCLGDTHQVDNPYLNQSNNALNWIVRMLKGQRNYGHLVLKGAKSRGPICDTILRTGL